MQDMCGCPKWCGNDYCLGTVGEIYRRDKPQSKPVREDITKLWNAIKRLFYR
jgi:hypothetical protein